MHIACSQYFFGIQNTKFKQNCRFCLFFVLAASFMIVFIGHVFAFDFVFSWMSLRDAELGTSKRYNISNITDLKEVNFFLFYCTASYITKLFIYLKRFSWTRKTRLTHASQPTLQSLILLSVVDILLAQTKKSRLLEAIHNWAKYIFCSFHPWL